MDEAETLNELTTTLNSLLEDPHSIKLHRLHIRLNESANLDVGQARQLCIQHLAVPDEIWLPLLREHREKLDVKDNDAAKLLLGEFEQAEKDYLSIDILKEHLAVLADLSQVEDGVFEEEEELRAEMKRLVMMGSLDLVRGNQVWEIWRDWELENLQKKEGSQRFALISLIDDMHLERLKQPHAEHAATLESYSTFTSANRPPSAYEDSLVEATELKQLPVKIYSRRERFETQSPDWSSYIAFERKKIDLPIIRGVFERAIADTTRKLWAADGQDDRMKTDLAGYWESFATVLRNQGKGEERDILARAVRSVPWSGRIWAAYLRAVESVAGDITEVYETAIGIKAINSDVEQLTNVVLSRGAAERRKMEEGVEDALTDCIMILESGISLVRKVAKTGDPKLRLERFLSDLYLTVSGEPLVELAVDLWKSAAEHYRTSYLAWTNYTEVLIKAGKQHETRKVFMDIALRISMDWPEAVWEAWSRFEALYGKLEDEERCTETIATAREKVDRKRSKDAEKESLQYQQYAAMYALQQQATSSTAAARTQLAPETTNGMEVENGEESSNPSGSSKRKAADTPEDSAPKRIKLDESLKRDRENCTVFVSGLTAATKEAHLENLFKDCGEIREVKLTPFATGGQDTQVATIEFVSRDSIPAALTKDKKKLDGAELSVYLAWQSTVYVTNFPESTNDVRIRQLFEPYGQLFETRWPSKKFKSTRRFCYVQFAIPTSAEAALELHGRELVPDQPLNVYISNPERKKERTDAGADAKEVYVAGLAKSTTKKELEDLFKQFGTIKDVRMATDPSGAARGFAFVEFEEVESAQKALGANNYELRKRRLAVTLADSRARAKLKGPTATGQSHRNEKLARSVRIHNLPEGTQEGLLQQVVEAHVTVKRVTVLSDEGEAIVELDSAADAGKLILLPEPIKYNGVSLRISEELLGIPVSIKPSGSNTAAPVFVPRAATSRPKLRAGLGASRKTRTDTTTRDTTFVTSGQKQVNDLAPPAKSDAKDGLGQDAFRAMLQKK